MHQHRTLAGFGISALLALGACAPADTTPPASAPVTPPAAAQPAPPDVGFSPDVTNAAVDACRSQLDAQTDGVIEVTGTEFSQANSAVYMVVGENRAPWRCLVSNDGQVAELSFIGNEGTL